jgi:hypothetical protein
MLGILWIDCKSILVEDEATSPPQPIAGALSLPP